MTYTDMASDLAEYIRKIRNETGFRKVHLLGHSMGGKAAMRLAIDPDGGQLIERLIVEGWGFGISRKRWCLENLSRFSSILEKQQNIQKS